jgi:hypothetical protein
MTTPPKIILVAGANGQLGQLMLTALQDRAARNGEALLVRALVRKGRSVPAPTPTLVYEAIDYTNPADLERVSEGAFAVVCCPLGVVDVIIGAQSGLLKAALGAGARRFIPSDFSGNFTKPPEGAHRNFDWRRQFHRNAAHLIANAGARMDFTSIYQGGFTELLASGGVFFDYKKLQVPYFGAADSKMEFTTHSDTAEYTTAAALDDAAGQRQPCARQARPREPDASVVHVAIGLWPPGRHNDRCEGINCTGPDEIIAKAYASRGASANEPPHDQRGARLGQ